MYIGWKQPKIFSYGGILMKKLGTTLCAIAVVLLALVFILPTEAQAATIVDSGTCGNNMGWNVDDEGTLTIFGHGTMYNWTTGYSPWPNTISAVVFEGGIQTIGSGAFYNCDSLQSITIPESVSAISSYAFQNCDNLESVTIGENVASIGQQAFSGCTKLSDVYISDVASWCGISFHSYDRTSNPLYYAGKLYLNGKLLTELTIPDSVTAIADNAFYNCDSIESVSIGNGVTAIGWAAFYNCSNLKAVTMGNKVTAVGYGAFQNCDSLTDVTIGSKVTTIDAYAFYSCDSLKKVNIPDNVITIGDYAFYNCVQLEDVVIGNGVKTIGDYAFNDCDNLTDVTIGNNVETIYGYAFYDCDNLRTITIPDSVTAINAYAFYNCDSLESVILGNSVGSIGEKVFAGCGSLTKITVGSGVASIGQQAFSGCTKLSDVYISDVASWCGISFHSYDRTSNPLYYAGKLYLNGKLLTELTIPDSVTAIADNAFYNCDSIESVSIGNGVTAIGWAAFYNCSNLKAVTMGNKVTAVGYGAFQNCDSLTDVTIGSKVTTIDAYAFYSCDSLKKVNIPDNVITIGDYAFYNCVRLDGVVIGDSVKSVGNYAFYNCINLSQVKMGKRVETVGSHAFDGCKNITSVTIQNDLKTVNQYAFYDCGNLEDVYYTGSETQWARITIYSYNECLVNATIHYNYGNAEGTAGSVAVLGDQEFSSLSDALKYAAKNGGGIVKLVADTVEPDLINIKKNVKLDLNGFSLTALDGLMAMYDSSEVIDSAHVSAKAGGQLLVADDELFLYETNEMMPVRRGEGVYEFAQLAMRTNTDSNFSIAAGTATFQFHYRGHADTKVTNKAYFQNLFKNNKPSDLGLQMNIVIEGTKTDGLAGRFVFEVDEAQIKALAGTWRGAMAVTASGLGALTEYDIYVEFAFVGVNGTTVSTHDHVFSYPAIIE